MPKLTCEEIKELLNQIIEAVTKCDSYYKEYPVKPKAGPPATNKEIAALEKHWNISLPPSYRDALSIHNGITHFWSNVPLLSSYEIIEDRNDTKSFEEPFPVFWRFIFACGTESYDALCFDVSNIDDDGEMPIVQLSDEGEIKRWSRFDVFLANYLMCIKKEIESEEADRKNIN